MRKLLFIILLVLQSAYSQKNYSELKELGLHGNVKSIIIKTYSSETALISNKNVSFNKNGNITKIVDSIYQGGELKIMHKEYLESPDGIKRFFNIKINGELVENGFYEWIDDRNYKITAFGDDAIKSEYRYYLNQNLRDSIGRTQYYLYDPKDYSTVEYLASSEYQNYLDKNGRLKSVIYLDQPENKKEVIVYKTLETDPWGNSTKVQLFEKQKDSLIEIRITKYYYY